MVWSRSCAWVLLSVLLVLAGAAPASGQDATPAAEASDPIAGLGLPDVTVTVADDGYRVDPAEVPAGRYLVTVVNDTSSEEAIVFFARLDGGTSLDDLSFADELASGTPIPEGGPSEEDLQWLYEAYLPGGAVATTDEPGRVVLELHGG